MILSGIEKLELFPVVDRGIANQERIPILIRDYVQIGEYGVMLGESRTNEMAIPYVDHFFWFGEGFLNPGDWIILYTGGGEPKIQNWSDPPNSKVYTVHWGKEKTLFASSTTVPILFKIGGLIVGKTPVDQPQLSQIANQKV